MSNYPPSDSEGWGYNSDPGQDRQQDRDPGAIPPGSDASPHPGGDSYNRDQQSYGTAPAPWPASPPPAYQQDPEPAVRWGTPPQAYDAIRYQTPTYPRNSQATTALLLSLLSVLFCCLPLSIPGMLLGKAEMNAIADGRTDPANRSSAVIAFVVGLIVTGLSALTLVLFVLSILLGIAAA